jgi:CAAX protease family protein
MKKWLAGFRGIAILILLLGTLAGFGYATLKNIPPDLTVRILPAALLEVLLYFGSGSKQVLSFGGKLPRPVAGLLLWVSALAPYLVYCGGVGAFGGRAFLTLAVLTGAACFWFVVFPRSWTADLSFIALMGGAVLLKVFRRFYVNEPEFLWLNLEPGVLGQLMWIRVGVTSIRLFRPQAGVNAGFWPSRKEWQTGGLYFLLFLPVAVVLNGTLHFAHLRAASRPWPIEMALSVATFFGILWVVAYSEEFFFRGLLQQWIGGWWRSPALGLIAAAALFGAAHLWFRRFPKWQFAVLAGVAGVFYGLAFRQGKGIRSAMVAHALVVTVWKSLFR